MKPIRTHPIFPFLNGKTNIVFEQKTWQYVFFLVGCFFVIWDLCYFSYGKPAYYMYYTTDQEAGNYLFLKATIEGDL